MAGYPWVPGLFVIAMTGILLNTVYERPVQSLLGVGLVALGVYMLVRRELFGVWPHPYLVSAHAHAVLVGFVMKKSKGRADPRKVNQLLAGRG